jgi:hypothetical protein
VGNHASYINIQRYKIHPNLYPTKISKELRMYTAQKKNKKERKGPRHGDQ